MKSADTEQEKHPVSSEDQGEIENLHPYKLLHPTWFSSCTSQMEVFGIGQNSTSDHEKSHIEHHRELTSCPSMLPSVNSRNDQKQAIRRKDKKCNQLTTLVNCPTFPLCGTQGLHKNLSALQIERNFRVDTILMPSERSLNSAFDHTLHHLLFTSSVEAYAKTILNPQSPQCMRVLVVATLKRELKRCLLCCCSPCCQGKHWY